MPKRNINKVIISKETYLEMKILIKDFEDNKITQEDLDKQPYYITTRIAQEKKYNPNYGDDRECKCGHPYHRHFDSYEEMYPIGCKYCRCYNFVEKKIKSKNNASEKITLRTNQ